MNTLKKDLFKFYITKDNKKYYFFSYVTIKQENGSESYYVVNPLVIWKGSDLQVAKDIIGLLMINKNQVGILHSKSIFQGGILHSTLILK